MTAGDIRVALRSILTDSLSAVSGAARICAASSDLLPVSGAAISVIAESNVRGTVCASDAVMTRIEDLQFTTGVGPCVDAVRYGRPVIVAELDSRSETRWPGFAIEAHRAGAAAIFALPLRIGAIRLGAIDFYRLTPGGLNSAEIADALVVAEAATLAVINMHDSTPAGDLDEQWWDIDSFYRAETHQATGMLMAILDVSAAEALVRLRARAFAAGVSIGELARIVVAREVGLLREGDFTNGERTDDFDA